MSWAQMRRLYNGAALRGGWDLNAPFQSTPEIANLVNRYAVRYGIPGADLTNMVSNIYNYDTLIASGRKDQAKDFKDRVVAGTNDPRTYKELWQKLRSRIHKGNSRGSPKKRKQKRQANLAWLADPNTPWWGSDPFDRATGERRGTYRGLYATSGFQAAAGSRPFSIRVANLFNVQNAAAAAASAAQNAASAAVAAANAAASGDANAAMAAADAAQTAAAAAQDASAATDAAAASTTDAAAATAAAAAQDAADAAAAIVQPVVPPASDLEVMNPRKRVRLLPPGSTISPVAVP